MSRFVRYTVRLMHTKFFYVLFLLRSLSHMRYMRIFRDMTRDVFSGTAQSFLIRYAGIAFVNPIAPQGSLLGIVCSVLDWVFYLSLPVGLIAILYAAFLFLTSGGDRNKVSSARAALIAAVGGWAV